MINTNTQLANVKESRASCRAEVGRALGETAELEVLTENDVGSIFQFLLDYGLPDENESVQLNMTEAGMAMCVAFCSIFLSGLFCLVETKIFFTHFLFFIFFIFSSFLVFPFLPCSLLFFFIGVMHMEKI